MIDPTEDLKPRDGGPAFAHGNPEQGGDPGMSLRDWFAGQAIQGFCTKSTANERRELAEGKRIARISVEAAYVVADAMLATRTKGEVK